MNQMARRAPWLLVFLAVAALGTACTLTTEPAYAEVEVAPPNIEASPSTVYEGQTVYLHDDRWYYRHGSRWVYYRREPEYLVRQRGVVRRAPPAPVRENEGPRVAPPAVQVR
jgi:hypothetical protein